jgi:hypothetical protein
MEFSGPLPDALHAGFSTAMSQATLLPACVIILGALTAVFFAKPGTTNGWTHAAAGKHAAPAAEVQAG